MLRSVAYNTAVQYFGKGIGLILAFFTTTLLIRALGVTDYGNYSIIYAITGIFVSLADFGFFWFTVRELADARGEDRHERLRGLTATRLTTLLLILLLYLLIVGAFYLFNVYDPAVRIVLVAAAAFIAASVLNAFFAALFQERMRMDFPLVADIAGKVAVFLIVSYSFAHGANFFMIAASPIIGSLLTVLLSGVMLRKIFTLPLRVPLRGSLRLVPRIFPFGIVAVLTLLYFKIDILILSLLRTSDDVGIYSAPYRMIELTLLLPGMFISSLYPALSQSGRDKEKMGLYASLGILLLACLAVPVLIFGLIYAKFAVGVVAGTDFIQAFTVSAFGGGVTAVTVFQILLTFVSLSFITSIIGPILFALDKGAVLVRMYIAVLLINVALNFWLIPTYSYLAAAAVTVVTELIVLLAGFAVIRSNIQFSMNWPVFLRWLGLAVLLGVAAVAAGRAGVHDVVTLPSALAAFSLLVWLTKSYDRRWKLFLKSADDEN